MNRRLYPPMLLGTALPEQLASLDSSWQVEPKMDGWRMEADIVTVAGSAAVRLLSRGDTDYTAKFPAIVEQLTLAVAGLHDVVTSTVLDGEMVAYDNNNLQNRTLLSRRRVPSSTTLYIFDVLESAGQPMINQPIEARRAELDRIFVEQPNIKRLQPFPIDDLGVVLEAARELHLEGIVVKKDGSKYRPGKRSANWLKYRFPDNP